MGSHIDPTDLDYPEVNEREERRAHIRPGTSSCLQTISYARPCRLWKRLGRTGAVIDPCF